jgi:hypothetical protein
MKPTAVTNRQMYRLQQVVGRVSSLLADLLRNQPKHARMTELLVELGRLDVAEVDDRLALASRKMNQNTTLLAHKVKAAKERGLGAELGVVLARMQAVLATSERTADETLAVLEQEVVKHRPSGKKPSEGPPAQGDSGV